MKAFKGRCLIEGDAAGTALVSRRAFTFAHGVDPATGDVTDPHSDLRGENVKAKILFYPFGKGSTTASAWFLETVRRGNEPAAVITEAVDLSAVIGSVTAKLVYGRQIPVLHAFPRELYKYLRSGGEVSVKGTDREVAVLR